MSCTRLIDAYQKGVGARLTFKVPSNPKEKEKFLAENRHLQIPCGKCPDCLIRSALDWTIRQRLEALTSAGSHYFVTLTYDDEHLPDFGFYDYSDVQSFHKSLKHRIRWKAKKAGLTADLAKFRFVVAPEYGDRTFRAHFHGNYFGLWLPDVHTKYEKEGRPRLCSPTLEKAWGKGIVDIQPFAEGSAAYVAKHNMKQNGENAKRKVSQRWYRIREEAERLNLEATGIALPVDWSTGEILPEDIPLPRIYASSRPAIGRTAFELFKSDFYPSDRAILNGREYPVPRYFDRLLLDQDPDLWARVMEQRIARAKDETDEDRAERERSRLHKARFFARPEKC